MLNHDTGIEFIDTETIKKIHCDRHRYIFYAILRLEDTFYIIYMYILHPNMDQNIHNKKPDFKEKCF